MKTTAAIIERDHDLDDNPLEEGSDFTRARSISPDPNSDDRGAGSIDETQRRFTGVLRV